MAQHNELGKKGEQLAVDYLIKKGLRLLYNVTIVFKKPKLILLLK